jgi:hypothetical protein
MELPYERQEDDWKCGAASLCMVYRSFGLDCSQAEVWPRVAGDDPFGGGGAPTYLLARDAQRRGLAAVAVQARDPWALLAQCIGRQVRVIVNQQLRRGSRRRHFAVVARVGDDHVIVHDPYHGAGLRYDRAEFLALWGAGPAQPEATGHVLVALDRAPHRASPCAHCGVAPADAISCPECQDAIPLHPAVALGCGRAACPGSAWKRLYCPHCDACLSSLQAASGDAWFHERKDVTEMASENPMAKLTSAFEKYQAVLGAAQAQAPASEARAQLQSTLEQMKSSFAQLQTEFEKEKKRSEEERQAAKEKMAAAQQKIEAAAKAREVAAQKKAAAQQARQTAQEIDPHLAEKLRSQLLEEFGFPSAEPTRKGAEKEWDWDDWPRDRNVTG